MSFSFRPARREAIGLLIGLAGPTGSGKTMSALRLATGIAGGQRFAVIDTENGRALHYADRFAFDHGLLQPPFRPGAYLEAIKAADDAGYPVIVVDSASHEHAGEGGLLDWHEEELDRMAGDDWKRRETLSMAAWVKPKLQHKQFVNRLLQINAHLILCFRAEEKVEMATERDNKGRTKTVIRPKRTQTGLDGWVPICEKNLPYELTVSLLFTADAPGVPKPIKMEQEHRLLVPLDAAITEEAGGALAKWAAGDGEPDPRVADLESQLLDCADELGNRETVTRAIQKHRRKHGTDEHVDWLSTQLERALDAITAAELPDVDYAATDANQPEELSADVARELEPTGDYAGGRR